MGERNLDEVIFKVITDSTQAANALQTGELDVAMDLKGESVQTVKDNADLTLLETPDFMLHTFTSTWNRDLQLISKSEKP